MAELSAAIICCVFFFPTPQLGELRVFFSHTPTRRTKNVQRLCLEETVHTRATWRQVAGPFVAHAMGGGGGGVLHILAVVRSSVPAGVG